MPIAAAFAISFVMPVLLICAALWGGLWLWGVPLYGWVVISLLDGLLGDQRENPDPNAPDRSLFWHRAVTWVWVPAQIGSMLFCFYAAGQGHLSLGEQFALFVGLGVATGGIGITYAHELIHQKNRVERGLGELLLTSVAYGHFTTEHLYNHHIYVGTPRDPVTARYAEGFWRFFPRAVWGTFSSAWEIDAERRRRRGLSPFGLGNPWWRWVGGTLLFCVIAWALAGWVGVWLFSVQCFIAILQLEAVNYVEHYGLTRKHLGDGRYEHAKPHHSWNCARSVSNLLLINLQRHSDHHYKPDRRYPLLQTYDEDQAPRLPFGYPLMVAIAMNPPIWFRVMNKRVKTWRKRHYPEITDWEPYKKGLTPMPGRRA